MLGDCRDRLKELPDNSIDSIVTDPPYELGFMGKSWDASGVAYDVTVWQECLRVLRPGGHLLSFGGSRTYHRMACAIEDAGFQIRDQIMWVYGSGFPKSLNISKAIDKAAGAEREVVGYQKLGGNAAQSTKEKGGTYASNTDSIGVAEINVPITAPATAEAEVWDGWGTALKPAHEPIVLARKPLAGTVANNVLTHGVGGINIDGCRVGYNGEKPSGWFDEKERTNAGFKLTAGSSSAITSVPSTGRFPANFIHDGSDEVLELFPDSKNVSKGIRGRGSDIYAGGKGFANTLAEVGQEIGYGDNGSAARFFYCAKASKKDRNEGLDGFEMVVAGGMQGRSDGSMGSVTMNKNHHPTVKPTELMRYLCRLITPLDGTVLDPFTGSGSTGKAAVVEGFNFIGVEQSEEYIAIAKARIESATK
jgi:site-specific DNA-methyltransferase (adenine-specific)